jgi:serine/threonine protein kinase
MCIDNAIVLSKCARYGLLFSSLLLFLILSIHTIVDVYELLKGSPLEEKTLMRIATSVLNALDSFHSTNLSHCDIKPSNIMVKPDGEFIVIDLGGAVELGSTVKMTSQFYPLDASKDTVFCKFDLNCLAVTIKEAGKVK